MILAAATLAALTMLTTTPEDALVGRWGPVKNPPRVFLELQPNGLGQVLFSAGIWNANDHEIRLVTPDKPDVPYVIPYSFEAKKLKVVIDRETLELERRDAPAEYRNPKTREQPQILSHGFVKAGSDVYATLNHDGGFMAISSTSWIHIPGASAKEFEALAPGVGKDAKGVYCFHTTGGRAEPSRLGAADPKTFRVLIPSSLPYFADAKNVFKQCGQLVKRERGGFKRQGSFDSKTFAPGPCGFVKDHSGLYALVPLPSEHIVEILDHLVRSQLSVYERVSTDPASITEQDCAKLPKPSPLTWDDLPPTAHP